MVAILITIGVVAGILCGLLCTPKYEGNASQYIRWGFLGALVAIATIVVLAVSAFLVTCSLTLSGSWVVVLIIITTIGISLGMIYERFDRMYCEWDDYVDGAIKGAIVAICGTCALAAICWAIKFTFRYLFG